MRPVLVLLTLYLCVWYVGAGAQQPAGTVPGKLNLVIVEGDGAINNIKLRTARETIVRVEDENHRPVASAAVLFLLPGDGPGGTFAGGAKSTTVTTDATGQAKMPRMQTNQLTGQFQIQVTASFSGLQAVLAITQTNQAGGAPIPAHHALVVKAIVIIGAAAAAGGVGYWASQHCFSNCTATPTPSNTISGGTPSLGAPPH